MAIVAFSTAGPSLPSEPDAVSPSCLDPLDAPPLLRALEDFDDNTFAYEDFTSHDQPPSLPSPQPTFTPPPSPPSLSHARWVDGVLDSFEPNPESQFSSQP